MTTVIDTLGPDDLARATPAQKFGEGFIRDCWHLITTAGELRPGALVPMTLLDEPVVVGRTQAGQAYALRDRCPHRAIPLSAGRHHKDPGTGQETLECAYHGWRFRTDGGCAAVPAAGGDGSAEGRDLHAIRVRAYPVVEQQGLVWIWMSLDAVTPPSEPPPRLPGIGSARPQLIDRLDYPVHVDHAILGLIDPAHGPYVHRQWWWRTAGSEHQKAKAFEPCEVGFVMTRHAPSKNSRAYAILGGAPQTEITFKLPGLRWEYVTIGKRHVLSLSAMTPLTATSTRMTQIVWSDHPVFSVLKPVIRLAGRAFLRQDGRITAAQAPGVADNPPMLWFGDADQQARWYVQLKREWQASRREGRPFRNPVTARILRWFS